MERFDDAAVRRILARARAADADPGDDGLDAATLVAAATEAGFDPLAVRRSIALEQLSDQLGEQAAPSALDRWAGPTHVVVRAHVSRDADEVLDLAAMWLERAHRMICRRTAQGSLVAHRRSDVAASFGRSLTELRGRGGVGRLAVVCVDVVEVPAVGPTTTAAPGDEPLEALDPPVGAVGSAADVGSAEPVQLPESLVQVSGDRTPQRRRRLTAGALLGGTGVATAAVGIAESLFAWPLAAAALGGAGLASVVSGRRQADRVEVDLEALLAALVDGRRPEGALRRLARAATRGARG